MPRPEPAEYCPTCGHRVGIKLRGLIDILRSREAGETLESIGQRYGVSRSRIHQIIKSAHEQKEPA